MNDPRLSVKEIIRGAIGARVLTSEPEAGTIHFNSWQMAAIKGWLEDNPPEGDKVMCWPEPEETEPKLSEVDPVKAIAVMVGGNQVMVRAAIRDKWTKLCYLAHKAHDELERDKKLSTLLTTYVSPANLEPFIRALEKEGLEIVPKQRKTM